MSIQPPQYNENDNYQIEINNLEREINNNQAVLTPLTPPPNYNIQHNQNILLDIDSEQRKTILYNLTNTLKSITGIFGISSIFYLLYNSDLLLLYGFILLLSIVGFYGLQHYKFIGAFNIKLYLILDIIIKLLIFLKEDNIFYTTLFSISILVNLYIFYLTYKWCKLINNLNEEELLQMKTGYKPENIYVVWH